MKTFLFILAGYLSGSVLFAQLAAKLFRKKEILENSKDKNPGTANAFQYGGFCSGLFTLCGDLLKGFLPVHLYLKCGGDFSAVPFLAALLLAAPVAGHAFPVFYRFQGGKGIAVTFGCLLGLYPTNTPVVLFALLFVFFSSILRVTPHFYRTVVTYLAEQLLLFRLPCEPGIRLGFLLITGLVCMRLHMSKEEREEMRIKVLWMH